MPQLQSLHVQHKIKQTSTLTRPMRGRDEVRIILTIRQNRESCSFQFAISFLYAVFKSKFHAPENSTVHGLFQMERWLHTGLSGPFLDQFSFGLSRIFFFFFASFHRRVKAWGGSIGFRDVFVYTFPFNFFWASSSMYLFIKQNRSQNNLPLALSIKKLATEELHKKPYSLDKALLQTWKKKVSMKLLLDVFIISF